MGELIVQVLVALPLWHMPRLLLRPARRKLPVWARCMVALMPWAALTFGVYCFDEARWIRLLDASLSWMHGLNLIVPRRVYPPTWSQPGLDFCYIASYMPGLMLNGCILSIVWLAWLHLCELPDEALHLRSSTSHGSAAWGTATQAKSAGRLVPKRASDGLLLGRMHQDVPKDCDPRYRVHKHVLTCAPTGAGKGGGLRHSQPV